MGCYSCGGNPNTFCRECNYPKDTWITPVDKLPDTFMGDFDHLFRTPDGNLFALSPDRTEWIQVNGSGGKDTKYTAGNGIEISDRNVITNTQPNVNQNLSINGRTISISNGNSITLPEDRDTVYNDAELKRRVQAVESKTDNFVSGVSVSRVGNKVKLTYTFVNGAPKEVEFEDKDTVTLAYDDSSLKARVSALESKQDRDNQSLSFNSSTRALSISNGNSVTIPSDKQTIRKDGNKLVLSNNGGEIDLPTPKDSLPYDDTALRERIKSLEDRPNSGGVVHRFYTGSVLGSADPDYTITVKKDTIKNPDGIKVGDTVEEQSTTSQYANRSIWKVEEVSGDDVKLKGLTNYSIFFNKNLSLNPVRRTLSMDGGNSVNLPNDIQTISKQGNKLILSNGGGEVELPTSTTSAPYDDSALRNRITALENKPAPAKQRLALSGNTLSLTDGGSVTLPQQASYNDTEVKARLTALEGRTDNDRQTLTLDNDTRRLSISNGNNVTLPNDRQSLTISGNTLSLSNGGGSITLPQLNVSGFVTLEEYNKLKGALENILINLRASGAWRQTGSTIFEGNLYSGRNIATGNINIFSGSTDGGTYIRTNNGLTENDLAGGV